MRLIRSTLLVLVVAVAALVANTGMAQQTYNGVSSWAPANGYDAPIFRQFAFVEGTITQYHVLKPSIFVADAQLSQIFQFPACSNLKPVIAKHISVRTDVAFQDSPTRQIIDVQLPDCLTQPTSQAQVLSMATQMIPLPMYVNAPILRPDVAGLPDNELFNGPPYRPRITAFQEGGTVTFITYEASWFPNWIGTQFASHGVADVFVVSYGSVYQPGFTIFNTAAGSPETPSFQHYSPVWRANCIVDADNQLCGSVNMTDPFNPTTGLGYFQCSGADQCLAMKNSKGHQVTVIQMPRWSYIDCPMVAVDLNGDHYIDQTEEITFPDLWVNGPVVATGAPLMRPHPAAPVSHAHGGIEL